jgi:hypothetical protein
MANFRVTLVDHTGSPDHFKQLILKPLQDLFNEVFAGTSNSATVGWGAAMPGDTLVLHLVQDISSSYITQKLPGSAIRPDDGGFTRSQVHVTGSEFYKVTVSSDGARSQLRAHAMSRLAFHEAMHDKTGWSNQKSHGSDGGGGLATSPPGHALTEKNRTIMQAAMANANAQLQ